MFFDSTHQRHCIANIAHTSWGWCCLDATSLSYQVEQTSRRLHDKQTIVSHVDELLWHPLNGTVPPYPQCTEKMSLRILWSCHLSHQMEIIATAKIDTPKFDAMEMEIVTTKETKLYCALRPLRPNCFPVVHTLDIHMFWMRKHHHCFWLLWASRWITFTYQKFTTRPCCVTDKSNLHLRAIGAVCSTNTFK